MSDTAAARREARRRRILENSHDRLQRIAGKTDSPVQSHEASPLPEDLLRGEPQPVIFLPESPIFNDSSQYIDDHSEIFSDDLESTDDLQSPFSLKLEDSAPATPIEKIFTTKLDIVIISLVFQLVFSSFQGLSYSLFLPVIIHGVMKNFLVKKNQESSLISAMLMLKGFTPSKVRKVTQVIQTLIVIAQDICIFLFVTVCFQSLWIMFGKKEETLL